MSILPNFTPAADRLRILRAEGDCVYSEHGRLVDMNSGYWTTGFGYSHSKISAASSRYYCDIGVAIHPAAENLADRLCAKTGYDSATFLCSGSSAIDASIRMSIQANNASTRTDVLTLAGCYHGSSTLCLALNGPSYSRWIPHLSITSRKIRPWVFRDDLTLEEAKTRLIRENIDWEKLAAFLFEPILGSGGVKRLNPYAYEAIATQCREHGIPIIADEVATGFGRSGYLARSETYTTKPDMLVLGKGITNGDYPLAAILLSKEMVASLESSTEIAPEKYMWGETCGGLPAACSTSLAVMDLLMEPAFLDTMRERANVYSQMITSACNDLSGVQEIRTAPDAMMFGVKVKGRTNALQVCQQLLRMGFRFVNEESVIMIMPMFITEPATVNEAISALAAAISTLI